MLKIETYITPKAHTHRQQPQPNDFCKKSTRVGMNAHPGSGGLWAG